MVKKLSGHIPNYANPERAQAAQGGYAAGNIRSMNMPGEGSVIYNSAETVKNFKGMSQPAIMPPHSSKAGKNYQQAFGDIHGFDPYAAGGYIPNFNRNLGGQKQGSLNAGGKDLVLLTGDQSGRDGSNIWYVGPNKSGAVTAYNSEALAKKRTTRFSAVEVPYFGLGTGDKSKIKSANIDEIDEKIRQTAVNQTVEIGKEFLNKGFKPEPTLKQKAERTFNNGAFSAAAGSTFESAMGAMLESDMFQDYSARTGTSLIDLPHSPQLFGLFGATGKGRMGGEVKGGLEQGLQKSAAEKFYKVLGLKLAAFQYKKGQEGVPSRSASSKFQAAGLRFGSNLQIPGQAKGVTAPGFRAAAEGFVPNFAAMTISRLGGLGKSKFGLAAVINSNPYFAQLLKRYGHWNRFPPQDKAKLNKFLLKQGFTNRALQGYGLASMHSKSIGEGIGNIAAAGGYIPNFADPLSDAIGREKAAGVPVSQIRVGSHGALMGKSNPLGLGVTNTHDEPNGLRDVFGANGFVPNYVDPVRIGSSDFNSPFSSMMGDQVKRFNKIMARFTRQFKQGEINFKELQARTQRLGSKMNLHSTSIESLVSKQSTSIKAIDKLNAQRRKYQNMLSRGNAAFNKTGAGKMLGSTGGQMGIMMGLPMAAGFFQDTVGGQVGASVGGALSGAGTGASMGMIFGPLGIAIGGAVGGLYGFINGLSEAEEALKEQAKARTQTQEASAIQGVLKATQKEDLDLTVLNKISKYKTKSLETLGLGPEATVFDAFKKSSYINNAQIPSFGELTEQEKKQLNPKTRAYIEQVSKRQKPYREEGYQGRDPEGILYSSLYRKEAAEIRGIGSGQKGAAKIVRNAAIDAILENEKNTFFDFNFGKQPGEDKDTVFKDLSKEEYSKVLRGESITRGDKTYKADLEKIDKELLIQYTKIKDAAEEQERGVILQLNLQKIMIGAQKKAREAQFNITSSMEDQASTISLMEKGMGGFITEQQKAQFNLIKSINKAAQTYASSAQQAEDAFESGMLGILKDEDTQAKVKTALAKQIGYKGDQTKLDLTQEFSKLSRAEREKLYEQLDLSDQIKLSIENQLLTRKNALAFAEKEVNAANNRVQTEFKINDAIAKRKDIISNLRSGGELMSQALGHAQAMRGMDAQVGAAQRLTDVGPGYQTRAEQEAFQMREKQIALENQIKTIRENATIGLQKEQTNLADIVLREKELATLKEQQYAAKYHGGRMADGTQVEFGENEQIRMQALIDEEDKRNQAKEKTQNAIDNIIEKSEKEISTAEKLLALEEKRLAAKRAHETGPGAFGNGARDAQGEMLESVKTFDYQLGHVVTNNFRDGLAEAMQVALSGAEDLDESLMQVASNFLQAIQSAFLQNAANAIVSAIPMPGGKSRGGSIRNYSRGGGVPAMVTNGEYVMGRDAVNKYGGSFMHGMNAGGSIPGFSNGGKLADKLVNVRREKIHVPGGAQPGSALAAGFGGGRGYASGRAYQSKAMSGFFYSQSGNIGLGEDTDSLRGILAEEERKRQEALAKKEKKKAFWKQLLGTALSAGISYGVGFGAEKGLLGKGAQQNALRPNADFIGPMMPKYQGGPIRKYASGGHIAGKSGIDQIPAMLSEGEYVIRASSARQIGKPMLDQINAGKFYDGGAVSEIAGSSETGSTGGNTNNISISINMERGSSNKKEQKENESSSQNPADRSNDEQSNTQLAERIKQQVVSVIVEEQRPGGLLSD